MNIRVDVVGELVHLGLLLVKFTLPKATFRPVTSAVPKQFPRPPRILIIVPFPPFPVRSGGAVRMFNMLKELAKYAEIEVITFIPTYQDNYLLEQFSKLGLNVHLAVRSGTPTPASFFTNPLPENVRVFANSEVKYLIWDVIDRLNIDTVVCEFTEAGVFLPIIPPEVQKILVEYEVQFLSAFRRKKLGLHKRYGLEEFLWGKNLDLLRLFLFETEALNYADTVHVMSEIDRKHIARFCSSDIYIVPNCVDSSTIRFCDQLPENKKVLYFSSFSHMPNLDALFYFLDEIWPIVRAYDPEAELTVAGSSPPEFLYIYNGRFGIEILGEVDDPLELYSSHRLMVVPLRAGSGTRLKILEAMAAGIPVVSTSVGVEGIAAKNAQHLLISDSSDGFASCILDLLNNYSKCEELRRNARKLVENEYVWSKAAKIFLSSIRLREDSDCRVEILKDPRSDIEISIIIPSFRGGERFFNLLDILFAQSTSRKYEVIVVDSGSSEYELSRILNYNVRLFKIPNCCFNHGNTRDLGARYSKGRVLVFLNQDAIPGSESWLQFLTDPLLRDGGIDVVQGGIVEDEDNKFYWGSGGNFFHFTSECTSWIKKFDIGLSTINLAMRKDVWEKLPFGWMPIMEDKKWQYRAYKRGFRIIKVDQAFVYHSHSYSIKELWNKLIAEGYGWRLLGKNYTLRDLLKDATNKKIIRHLIKGIKSKKISSIEELLFPIVRPLAIYYGTRWKK